MIKPRSKPKTVRQWLAWRLVDLARWISPKNEAVMAYLIEKFTEYEIEEMKYGRAAFEIKVVSGEGKNETE